MSLILTGNKWLCPCPQNTAVSEKECSGDPSEAPSICSVCFHVHMQGLRAVRKGKGPMAKGRWDNLSWLATSQAKARHL